jgi:hypothetical protein
MISVTGASSWPVRTVSLGFECLWSLVFFFILNFLQYSANLTLPEPHIPIHILHPLFYFFEVSAGSDKVGDKVLHFSHA